MVKVRVVKVEVVEEETDLEEIEAEQEPEALDIRQCHQNHVVIGITSMGTKVGIALHPLHALGSTE